MGAVLACRFALVNVADERVYERQEAQFKKEQRDYDVNNMVIDNIIAKCGKPLKDVVVKDDLLPYLQHRYVYFKDARGDLMLMKTDSRPSTRYPWEPPIIMHVENLDERDADYAAVVGNNAQEKLERFPCMDPDKKP